MKTWDQMTIRDQLVTVLWDAFKDAHGFRPRHLDLDTLTVVELEAMIKDCEHTIAHNETLQEQIESAAVQRVEALIADLIKCGAADREAAIRWLDDAHQCDGDREFLCYNLDLPYGYFNS